MEIRAARPRTGFDIAAVAIGMSFFAIAGGFAADMLLVAAINLSGMDGPIEGVLPGWPLVAPVSCVVFAVLWMNRLPAWWLFGSEVIAVQRGRLERRLAIGRLAITTRYALLDVMKLRAEGPFNSEWPVTWLNGGPEASFSVEEGHRAVAFEHRGKRRELGLQLSEQDANSVVEALHRFLPAR